MRKTCFICAVVAAALLATLGAPPASVDEDRIWHHRNLGKAYYESPNMLPRAAEEFRNALDLAPDSFRERLNYGLALVKNGQEKEGVVQLEQAQKQRPEVPHTWFNLGIAYKRAGRFREAITQFERMIRLVPREPVSHYNLGLLYSRTGREREALEQLDIASRLDPGLVAPYYLRFSLHRAAGRKDEAQKALAAFQEAKRQQKAADESEDMEWSYYAEIYDPVDTARPPEPAVAPLKFEERLLPGKIDAEAAGFTVLDFDGDRHPDLLAWSRSGIRAYRGGATPVDVGLTQIAGVRRVAAGDFDNDGLADLCVLTDQAALVLRGTGERFEPRTSFPGSYTVALWLDYDHDYDQDLLLFGDNSVLLRNEGTGGFRPVEFPFAAGRPVDAALFRLVADSKGTDIAVSYAGRGGVLYRDRMRGRFEAEDLGALPSGAAGLTTFDMDADGWFDLAYAGGALRNREGKLERVELGAAGRFVFADLDNSGAAGLVSGGTVTRGSRSRPLPCKGVAWAAADFDRDGRIDLACATPDGAVRLLLNRTEPARRSLGITLEGVKNLKLASGTEIELKAGASYQKRWYDGVPLLFGLGGYSQADTVRITWPNGMIQNIPQQAAGSAVVKEAPRLSGSCPMIFAWNGRAFEFITDVLGVAPLGASSGGDSYFAVDHDEHIQIPGGSLAAVNGAYQLRFTEELREVSYIDQVRLIAVDHPDGMEIVTNEKFKSPPFPEFRLFGVRTPLRPLSARDGSGRDVWPAIARCDGAYVDTFRRDSAGVAELHSLTLDFGPAAALDGRAVLILNGWVDWADGSTFAGAAQPPGGGLVLPYLETKDEHGRWRKVIGDMGVPAGKPKTIAVDLTGRFLSSSREVRIVTNLCVYWDEVYLSEETGAPPVRLTSLAPSRADLRFRGFSQPRIHPGRKQPEWFDYDRVLDATMWNQTPGLYTRYGETRELLETVDDRFVIMGSGDELALSFEALPAPAGGMKRDFLLLVDGWAKDGDANTAFAGTVEPLPFHAMSRYPYPADERYPDDDRHREYLRKYVTRPALRLIRPLR